MIQSIGGYEGADLRPRLAGEEGIRGAEVFEFFGMVGGVEEVGRAGRGLGVGGEGEVPPEGRE